jgi:hypothetical protein
VTGRELEALELVIGGLPLRSRGNRSVAQTPASYRMQLFDLSPVRHAVGLLFTHVGAHRRGANGPKHVCLGRQATGFLSMRVLRMRYPLAGPSRCARRTDGRQREAVRPGHCRRLTRPASRRGRHLEIPRLNYAESRVRTFSESADVGSFCGSFMRWHDIVAAISRARRLS